MSTSTGYEHLLNIEPTDLNFPFELRKQSSCCLKLTNKTDDYVAFKIKTTDPKKYWVNPNIGTVYPGTTCEVTVTREAPQTQEDMQLKEKFLIQSFRLYQTALKQDIKSQMFNKQSVDEFKLMVIFHAPANHPEPLVVPNDGSENGSQKARFGLFDSVRRRIGLWGGGGGGSRKTQMLSVGEETTSMSSLKEPLLPN